MIALQTPREPLSAAALRLLGVLRDHRAACEASALRDHQLAHLCGLPQRCLIDCAAELLAAGYLVCATCGPTPGRFLVGPGGDLRAAQRYLDSLTGRAMGVLRRRRLVRRALALAAARRSPDHTGQLGLWPGPQPHGPKPLPAVAPGPQPPSAVISPGEAHA